MQPIHLICAADLHLGRQVGKETSYVLKAWENLIELCLSKENPVEALLLAGDIIDGDDLFIEMYGVLKKGIRRLLERGVQVIAIAGNHDSEVLRQIEESLDLPGFHLLGKDGSWERFSPVFKGRRVHFDGISFTAPYNELNPFDSYHLARVDGDEPLIGLLHCDVDVTKSRYAPVRLTDFQKMPHGAWFLGHIHIPRELSLLPRVRYCGSLQGLDVGEPGARGALQITIQPNGKIEVEEKRVAPLRWEWLELDLTDLSGILWEGVLCEKIEAALIKRVEGEQAKLELIGVRLILEGRTSLFKEVQRIQHQEAAGISIRGKWIPYFIESVQNKTRPVYDLERLSLGNDFVALLAKELLTFQKEEVLLHLEQEFRRDSTLKQIEGAWPSQETCADLYLQKGFQLLDTLLGQKQ